MPPEKRNISIVFQDYALFPNMTVAKNIGYEESRIIYNGPVKEELMEESGIVIR